MDIFLHRRLYWSAQNGLILFNKKSGDITVRGTKQTSKRYPTLWAGALRECLNANEAKHILLLGLGGGGVLSAVHERHAAAQVTAVEHDPTMVKLAQALHIGTFPFPHVVLDDAQVALQNFNKKFDLILIDLFLGAKPIASIKEPSFWDAVRQCLAPGGAVVLNLAGSSGYEDAARATFSHAVSTQSSNNRFLTLYE